MKIIWCCGYTIIAFGVEVVAVMRVSLKCLYLLTLGLVIMVHSCQLVPVPNLYFINLLFLN